MMSSRFNRPKNSVAHYSDLDIGRQYYRVSNGGIEIFFLRGFYRASTLSTFIHTTRIALVTSVGKVYDYQRHPEHDFYSLRDMHVMGYNSGDHDQTYNDHYLFTTLEDAIDYLMANQPPRADNWRGYIQMIDILERDFQKNLPIPDWVVDYARSLYEYEMSLREQAELVSTIAVAQQRLVNILRNRTYPIVTLPESTL